jgi:tRNA(fMet)-specific endonuclease VapC
VNGKALIDTDVFSYIIKRDSRARLYEDQLAGMMLLLSFMTVAELRLWVLQRRWGESRRADLEDAIARTVVLLPDDKTCRLWAELSSHRRRLGRPIGCGDGWVAATALRHNVTLFTHNGTDFADVPDLRIVCP